MTDEGALPVTKKGRCLTDWQGARRPDHGILAGTHCRLEPIKRDHVADLFSAYSADETGANWQYLPYGPFVEQDEFAKWVDRTCFRDDPFFYAIIETTGNRPIGMASYLRVNPDAGSIEVGHINFAPALQRKPAASETMFLMMRHAFEDLGYRRYEWKCNNENLRSKAAALRLGFSAEGVFRQAAISKGRNRDTAWFSVLDNEWPRCRAAFLNWLSPENFDEDGRQKTGLATFRKRGD